MEVYGTALRLEAAGGAKTKLKEYLLSEDMALRLQRHSPPLKLVLVKAGHDRRYSVAPDV